MPPGTGGPNLGYRDTVPLTHPGTGMPELRYQGVPPPKNPGGTGPIDLRPLSVGREEPW